MILIFDFDSDFYFLRIITCGKAGQETENKPDGRHHCFSWTVPCWNPLPLAARNYPCTRRNQEALVCPATQEILPLGPEKL